MARGFESKDVEFQQAEAERKRSARPRVANADPAVATRRRTIELSLTRARGDLALARSDAHRRMLTAAIDALEQELTRLG